MASKKKKDHEPQNMKELEDLYYKEENFEARKKYENGFAVGILTEAFERQIADRINFQIEKIPEMNGIKTPDFISMDRKTIIEATSIIMAPIQGERIDPDETERWHRGTKRIDKINESINHAIEKDYDYLKRTFGYDEVTGTYFLFVLVDVRIAFFFGFYDGLEEAVTSSIFIESGLSGIAFITESSGFSRRAAYVKKGRDLKLREVIPISYIE